MSTDLETITKKLLEPFPDAVIKWKPGATTQDKSKALAMPYVDARAVQDRLDQVVGVLGWKDEYEFLSDGSALCRLSLRINEEWITKMDVGSPSEQPDEGDRRKAALSDALKRAAVKFGIGRHLYSLTPKWVEYDAKKKRLKQTPTLGKSSPSPGSNTSSHQQPTQQKQPSLYDRLRSKDKALANAGYSKPGEFLKFLEDAARSSGYPTELKSWSTDGPEFNFAKQVTKDFESEKGVPTPAKPERLDHLKGLMKDRGKTTVQVLTFLRIDTNTKLESITTDQCEKAIQSLESTHNHVPATVS